MPVLRESEHTTLMISLIINLLLAVSCLQTLACAVIDKFQKDFDSPNSKLSVIISLCVSVSSPADFNRAIILRGFHLKFLCAKFGHTNRLMQFVFESLQRSAMTHDGHPSSKLSSCALPGRFQSSLLGPLHATPIKTPVVPSRACDLHCES